MIPTGILWIRPILLVFYRPLECEAGSKCTIERGHCEGGYLLREHFTVNFEFKVSALPIERFPAADQELRRRLEAAEVRDFKWAQEPAGNTSGDKQ
jgi:hypothetical protein